MKKVNPKRLAILVISCLTVIIVAVFVVHSFVANYNSSKNSPTQEQNSNSADSSSTESDTSDNSSDDQNPDRGLNEGQIQIEPDDGGDKSITSDLDSLSNTSNNVKPSPIITPQTATEPYQKDGVIIVNKKHPLPQNYSPSENPEAASALKKLIVAAQKAGVDVIDSYSGYRSFSVQADLYQGYVNSAGQSEADTYSARPGYSEHQTGLAFDLKSQSGNLYRIDDQSYDYSKDWIAQNAAKFGFIIRYRDEWQSETGYVGEPWHLRYLGVDLAEKVFKSNKTLEEYLGVTAGDYDS